jgi:hypothetical protein
MPRPEKAFHCRIEVVTFDGVRETGSGSRLDFMPVQG